MILLDTNLLGRMTDSTDPQCAASLHAADLRRQRRKHAMRKWARLLTAAILVGVAGLYPLLAPPPHRIDQEHFDRIAVGMKQEHVETIFGVPAGEYDWTEQDCVVEIDWTGSIYLYPKRFVWTSSHGTFTVLFNAQDYVVATSMTPDVRIVPPWQRWWREWKK